MTIRFLERNKTSTL